jgi:hypothetical protein
MGVFRRRQSAENPIDWSRDPLTGVTAPQDVQFSINHRDRAWLAT